MKTHLRCPFCNHRQVTLVETSEFSCNRCYACGIAWLHTGIVLCVYERSGAQGIPMWLWTASKGGRRETATRNLR